MTMWPRTADRFRGALETPLLSIFRNWSMNTNRCARLLLDAGADPNVRSEGAVSFEDPDHFSPLNLALDDCT